ncbi:putative DEAD-box ATP-dependent RNA helicase 33 [Prosopis cineraria]|uniref:putative DEAD-box ATP-dependent RNA helicase 33 n=1 Tax=Prosopis cineraria TaxID=364024 RepID=UPI00240EA60D|nr:putative DEAD-box ATP-dependent RNA helicase 33 [Prosopis cineraria]
MNLLIPNLPQQLNFSGSLASPCCLSLQEKLSHLSLSRSPMVTPKGTVIRMGGGPRTYPGGVSKWQWKKMQAKKAKQLLKARLCRERQIYEMRKRAELKAAVSELERPWEVVERAPTLFSVKADEQLKVLADRFQKPGGFDMWSERDGPQLFETPDELPSARFFPKGVVHSIRPYRRIDPDELDSIEGGSESEADKDFSGNEVRKRTHKSSVRKFGGRSFGERNTERGELSDQENGSYSGSSSMNSDSFANKGVDGKFRKRGNRRKSVSRNLDGSNGYLGRVESGRKQRGHSSFPNSGIRDYNRGISPYASPEPKDTGSEVYDMSLQQDGSYGFAHSGLSDPSHGKDA